MDSAATVTEEVRDDVWNLEKDQAREIQQSLLPVATLKDPRYEVACRYSPLAEVGGDFADFFILPNDMVGIYIGDVVGKGLAAAMYGALVMGMLRGVHKEGKESAAVLALLNRRLMVRPVPGRYCATLYAIYDPSSRELTFSNAGLPYPVHASHSCATPLGNGGVPSGLFADSDYDTHTVQLAPGDAVLFATDGLHEMRNEHSEDFSWGKLGEVWRRSHKMPAEDSLEMLFKEMHRFASGLPRSDDITAVVLRIPWEENGE